MDLKLAEKVAVKAVKAAGKIVVLGLHKEKKVSYKGRGDIVTHVDLESEKIIIKVIEKSFPTHSILSEETGFIDKKSEYVWVLDPIDGTMNYYHGFDSFCIGLGLVKGADILINVIYNPAQKKMYVAQKGKGVKLNGKKIEVSKMGTEDAFVVTGPSLKKQSAEKFVSFLDKIYSEGMHVRMIGSGLLYLACVADGTAEVALAIHAKPWDVLPAALLVTEAGGVATDANGQELNTNSDSFLAANTKEMHSKMLALLR